MGDRDASGRGSSGRRLRAAPENQRRTIWRRAGRAGAPWVPARAAEASTPWRQRMDTGPVRASGPPAFVFPELRILAGADVLRRWLPRL